MRRALLWVGSGLAALLAGTAFLPGRARTETGVPVVRAELAPFVHQVPAEGNFKASRATPIVVPAGVPSPLRIAWLAVEGARVKAGETVARFDPTDLQKTLQDAEDDLAKSRLKTEKEKVEDSADLRKLAADAQVAELELEGARRFQKKDETLYSRSERIESELDGSLAGERVRHAREAEKVKARLSQTELDLLAIQSRQAGFKIDTARQGLASLTIGAPYDGILVFRRDFRGTPPRVGDSIWEGQPLGDLPDLSRMEAEVYVLEADAGGLAVGKPAVVTAESAPDKTYPARIARVDPLAKPRLRGSPVQYFAVVLELAHTDPLRMKPGARVRALLTLDNLPRALALPREAIFERGGRPVVYRRTRGAAGGFAPVAVTLGPSGMGRVVVTAGLAAGDEIALLDPDRNAAGNTARPTTNASPARPAAALGGLKASRRALSP
ncbi:MAG TPA: HlyD family efflux transporter periplasmic adaptor subunit [Thermoanaerobaculia bacterium]|nr:HlyD family efflux transporter periplasmic adaptor subunit [Thermoanaerobaculia bacterium]